MCVCVCVCVPSVPSYVPSIPWTFCPLNWNFNINRPKRPGCPWHVPNLSLGRFRGIPTTKFLYELFLSRFFSIVFLVLFSSRDALSSFAKSRVFQRCLHQLYTQCSGLKAMRKSIVRTPPRQTPSGGGQWVTHCMTSRLEASYMLPCHIL